MINALRVLSIGVIRDPAKFRANAKSGVADQEYRAVRKGVMASQRYKCGFCGWKSQKNECHHMSGNHADNSNENLVVADTLCHGYHHLGQRASQERFSPDNLGTMSVLASVPELSPADTNLLLRAVGVALSNEAHAETAASILTILSNRARPVKDAFGTFFPGDFAAAMTMDKLTESQYEAASTSLLSSFRLIYHKDVLKEEAKKFKEDFPALPIDSWEAATRTRSN